MFADHGVSGTATTRPGLVRALKALKPGDTFVVWRLDRLGRSLSHPAQVMRARSLIDSGESPHSVATTLHVGRTTVWRALKAAS